MNELINEILKTTTFVGVKNGDRLKKEFGFTDEQIVDAWHDLLAEDGDGDQDDLDLACKLGERFGASVRCEDAEYEIGGN